MVVVMVKVLMIHLFVCLFVLFCLFLRGFEGVLVAVVELVVVIVDDQDGG